MPFRRGQEINRRGQERFRPSALSYSYDDTRTVDDESTILPRQSPLRAFENFLLGTSQSIEHITSEASSSDDDESGDGTRDDVNFFKPYPFGASISVESRAATNSFTYESFSFEVPDRPRKAGKDKGAISDPVRTSDRVHKVRGGFFGCSTPQTGEEWSSSPNASGEWRRQRSETTGPLSPISPTGNPVVLHYPPHFHHEAKLKEAIDKTPSPKQVQPQPLHNKSMKEDPPENTADPSRGGKATSPGCAILPIWSLEEDEIVFEDGDNDIEHPTIWDDPRLWSSPSESRKSRNIKIVRGAVAKQSDSGQPDSAAKSRGLLSRLKPKAGVKVLQKLQATGNKYLRSDPDKSTAVIDTRQCQEDSREVDVRQSQEDPREADVVYWLSPTSDLRKGAIVSPREPADQPRRRVSPPWRQRLSPRSTPSLLVETQNLQASPEPVPFPSPSASPKREGLDSPMKNLLRTRIPRFPTSPFSPSSEKGPSNVRIVAPGPEETEGIEVAERSPRKILSQSLSRAFKTSKAKCDDGTPNTKPGLALVPTSSTSSTTDPDVEVDDNIELTTENWQMSVSKWFEFSPKNRSGGNKAGAKNPEDQETHVDSVSPVSPEDAPESKESTHNVTSESGHVTVPGSNATLELEPNVPPRSLPEHLPKSAVKPDKSALTLAAVATKPDKIDEQLFPKMKGLGSKREQKTPKTFQAPTSPKVPTPKAPTPKARTVKKNAPDTNIGAKHPSLLESRVSDLSETSMTLRLHSPFGRKGLKPKKEESKTKTPLRELGTSSPKPRKNVSPPDSTKLESKITPRKHHSTKPLQKPKPSESAYKIKTGDHQNSKAEIIPSKLDDDLPVNEGLVVGPHGTAVSQPGCLGGLLHLQRAVTPKIIPSRSPSKSPPVVLYPILDFNPCHAELLLGDDGSINLLGDDESIISRLESKDLQPRKDILSADSTNDPALHKDDLKAQAPTDKTDIVHDDCKDTGIELTLETREEHTAEASKTQIVRRLINQLSPKIPVRKNNPVIPARKNNPVSTQAPVKAPFRALLRGDKRKAKRNRAFQEAAMKKALKASLKPDGGDSDKNNAGNGADPQTLADSVLVQTEGMTDHQKAIGEMVATATAYRVCFEQDLFESCLKPRYAELPARLGEGGSPLSVQQSQTKPAIRKGRFSGGSTTSEESKDQLQLQSQLQVDQQHSSEAFSSGACGLAATLQALTAKATCAAHDSTTASHGDHSHRTAKVSNKEQEKHESASVTWSLPSSIKSGKTLESDRRERARLDKVKEKLARRVNNDLTLLHSKRSMEIDRKEGERLEGVKEKLARRLTADLKLLALVEKKKSELISSNNKPSDGSSSRSSGGSDKYLESLDTMLILKAIDDLVTRRMDEEAKIRKDAAAKENSFYFGNVLSGMFSCSAPAPVEEPKTTKALYEA